MRLSGGREAARLRLMVRDVGSGLGHLDVQPMLLLITSAAGKLRDDQRAEVEGAFLREAEQ